MRATKLGQVLSYRDFRLLWIGAFISFSGSWVSQVARGFFVYRLTGDESKLGLINFAWSIPVCVFGLFAGSATDMFNKRVVLVIAQLILGATAIFLAVAIWMGFIQYWMILLVALINGFVSCIEMPTRQSIVSSVVPPDVLPAAVPVNAMTFNVARVMGPALGAVVLASMGVATCFLIDGLSYLAIIWSVIAIQANLRAKAREPQPLGDLITEGAIYTWRDRRLRSLFLLENLTATFGLAFLPLLPAFVQEVMHQGIVVVHGQRIDLLKQGIGWAYTAVGVGSICALLVMTSVSDTDKKALIIRGSMLTLGVALPLLSIAGSPWLAYPLLAVSGGAIIMQLNTTNTLFQILAPERLRGRVLAMHIWAVNGISPFGVLVFGWLAKESRIDPNVRVGRWMIHLPDSGVSLILKICGGIMLLGGFAACMTRRGLSDLHQRPAV
jgi:MFS family permease